MIFNKYTIQRHINRHQRSFARATLEPDVAPVSLRYLPDITQSQS